MAVHGVTLVFPCSGYSIQANLEAIEREKYDPRILITQITFKIHIRCRAPSLTCGLFSGYSRCNLVYGTPTMFIDMLSQDLHKYDLSSVEAGKKFQD